MSKINKSAFNDIQAAYWLPFLTRTRRNIFSGSLNFSDRVHHQHRAHGYRARGSIFSGCLKFGDRARNRAAAANTAAEPP